MKYNSNTFCSAPWFQIRKELNDEYRSCCEINPTHTKFKGNVKYNWPTNSPKEFLNSEYVQYLKQNLNEGIRLPECQKCWSKESLSQKSERQMINDTVTNNHGTNLNNTWVHSYFKQKNNFDFDYLISSDIKVSNLCNFSCIMCNPSDSSQIYSIWQKNKTHPIVQTFLDSDPEYLVDIKKRLSDSNYDYLSAVLDMCPKHVKILGGEPLIDKILLKKLIDLPSEKKAKISLLFVTNGSIDLTDFANLLAGYKQVNYVVSLEGIESVQDYLRRGSVWHQIEKNILKWNLTHRSVDILFTLQCFNAMHISECYKWCCDHNMKFKINIVENPDYLSVRSIPPVLREKILKKFAGIGYWSSLEIDNFKQIIIDQPYDKKLLARLKEFTDWYDPLDHWKNIFPEWNKNLL